jgi:hypothetical protein
MHNFSPQSKVWIYQAERRLTADEQILIHKKAENFLGEWTAHGKHLLAKIDIYHNQFLVLFVDESQANASGCGIDKSIHFFQQIENELSINLMNRLLVAYKVKNEIVTCSLKDFEAKVESGEITADNIVFNNLVSTKAEFDTAWEIPLSKSWHNKLLV